MTTTTLSASGITKTLAMSNLTSNSMPAKVATIRSQYVKGNEPGTTGTGRQQSGNHISLLETVSTIGPNSLLGSNASALAAERLVSVPETFRFADIQLGECLSRGESTVVSKGRIISSGQEVVVKMAQTGSSDAESTTQDIISEIRLLSGLNHPRLVTLLGACFDPLHLALVTELIPGGNLYSALHVQRRCFLPSERFQLGCDLLEGAGYLHSQSPPVVHLDLKSMNLVLDASGQHLQICDFGLARTLSAAGGASGSSSSNGNGASNGNDDRPLNIDSSCSSSSGKRGNVCSIALHHNADEDEDLDLDLDLVVDVDTGLTSFARASPSAEKARGTNDNNNNSNGNNSNNSSSGNSHSHGQDSLGGSAGKACERQEERPTTDRDDKGQPRKRPVGGTLRYMSPERHDTTLAPISTKADVWSAGCVLIELFEGGLPFAECRKVQQIVSQLLVHRKSPQPVAELLSSMLKYRAEDRLDLEKALARLQEIAAQTPSSSGPRLFWKLEAQTLMEAGTVNML